MTEIRVPTLGELVTEATIGKWFKKAGDPVAVDEPLVELETDKVTIEVPAPAAGVLGSIAAQDGETVAVGALLGQITEGAGGRPSKRLPPEARRARTRGQGAARVPQGGGNRNDPATCRCRLRCANSRPKPASSRRPSRAPARTAASPRATCWRRSSGQWRRPRPSRSPRPRSRRARRRRPTMHRAKSA